MISLPNVQCSMFNVQLKNKFLPANSKHVFLKLGQKVSFFITLNIYVAF